MTLQRKLFSGVLLCFGLVLLLNGSWIKAKAFLAQWLLESAWQETLEAKQSMRPWFYADHLPVGRLDIPRQKISQVVLNSDSGHALAFAPGHNPASPFPGEPGRTIVSGHRDTHFQFLKNVKIGEELKMTTLAGTYVYQVVSKYIVDSRTHQINPSADRDRLLLVTCYPFDTLVPGGPLRYLVEAEITKSESRVTF